MVMYMPAFVDENSGRDIKITGRTSRTKCTRVLRKMARLKLWRGGDRGRDVVSKNKMHGVAVLHK